MNKTHPLYLVGRTCVSVFAILLVEGVALALVPLPIPDPTAQMYMKAAGIPSAVIAPFGLAASLGIMRGKNWGRYLLSAVLAVGALAIAAFGVFFLVSLAGAPESQVRGGKLRAFTLAPVVIAVMCASVVFAIKKLLRHPFEAEGHSGFGGSTP